MTRLYTRLIISQMTRLIQHLISLIVGIPMLHDVTRIRAQTTKSKVPLPSRALCRKKVMKWITGWVKFRLLFHNSGLQRWDAIKSWIQISQNLSLKRQNLKMKLQHERWWRSWVPNVLTISGNNDRRTETSHFKGNSRLSRNFTARTRNHVILEKTDYKELRLQKKKNCSRIVSTSSTERDDEMTHRPDSATSDLARRSGAVHDTECGFGGIQYWYSPLFYQIEHQN